MTYRLEEVFNEALLPSVTFVPPRELPDLLTSLRSRGKHITISGPSGCGKTTLVKKALEKIGLSGNEYHWISGRDYAICANWTEVFAQAFGCLSNENEILQWMGAAGLLVVDDFHHLALDVRNQIGYKLKRWGELGHRFVLIGIAASSNKLLEVDSELAIRNDPYELKTQDDDFIERLIRRGQEALNITFEPSTFETIVKASQGIPSAAHVICKAACVTYDVVDTLSEPKSLKVELKEIKESIIRTYRAKYHNRIVGLVKGKRQARSVHNTYFEIVKNICLIQKSEFSTRELWQRIAGTEPDPALRNKKSTSFYNCLKNLDDIIKDRALEDALYYDKTGDVISIEDPSFRFYLNFVEVDELRNAVRVRSGRFPWDVAVSFAGENRRTVEEFRDYLNSAGYSVFYDFDHQHILWGQNLREKLGDVYANES
jgi:hypothetical protein